MALLVGSAAVSQEQADAEADAQAEAEEQQSPGAEGQEDAEVDDGEPAFDESVLDDQTYEGDDDVFIPSEEVPVDEPIPFPTDI